MVCEQTECKELRYLLEGEGYEVDRALCGTEALSRIEQEPFDVILIEIPAPDIDGVTMLRRIRETEPNAAMIVMGGYVALEAAIEAWQCDISGYLSRPFDEPDEVLAAVTCGLADHNEMMIPATIRGVPVALDGDRDG
jgi:DNA-binding NtrC family response regulator